jgi:predicted acyl esterase
METSMRKFLLAGVMLGVLWVAPAANAAIPSVFGGDVTCNVAADNVRECGSTSPRSTTETFDGIPLDINVAFPPDDAVGPDGDYPLIVWGHGYGGAKIGFGTSGSTTSGMRRFTSRGYAVMSMTTRGFRESCGSPASRTAAGAACDNGYVRLMDTRFEVRDYQYLAGLLADDDLIDPQKIGAVGGSYGGGLSMALAALKNRVMMPDGSLAPWMSTGGDPMQVAAAVPSIPWTDLTYSLVPNGRTLDYVTVADQPAQFGVMKESLVNGLYVSGQNAPGLYAGTPPAPADPDADLTGWLARLSAGEPYDGDPVAEGILNEIRDHHSSFHIDHSIAPAPLLISSGFTDDLFPADEAIRFYHRTREEHPSTPVSLFFGNFGHQRAANRPADGQVLTNRENAWLDFYVRGVGATPFQGVESTTQVCPNTDPSEGPFGAANWARSASGEIRFFDGAAKTIASNAGDITVGQTFNPALNGQPCGTASGADIPGSATYRLPAVTGAGFVMLGSPTVIATIGSGTNNNQIAARLVDVGPNGQETLVSRGLYRPGVGTASQVFQLHPNGYRFAAGHVPKLELLAMDSGGSPLLNYARPSNGQGNVTIDDLKLRLPVMEKPGAQNGLIGARAAFIVPPGQQLAKDFADLGVVNAGVGKGKLSGDEDGIEVKVASPQNWEACHATIQVLGGKGKTQSAAKKKKGKPLAKGKATVVGGKTKKITLKLTKKGKRKLAGRKGKLKVKVVLTTREQAGKVKAKRTLLLG